MFKHLAHVLLLSLVWLLMWCFSHDYVASNTNQDNQQRLTQIEKQALNYRWSMHSLQEVVASFRDSWQVTDHGLHAQGGALGMSLELQGRWIDPRWQQSLLIDYQTDSGAVDAAWLKLEFSNQQRQIYYVSPDIKLSDLSMPIDLTAYSWLADNQQQADAKAEFFAWQAVPPTNALVLRWFFPEATAVTIKQVELRQSQGGTLIAQACHDFAKTRHACHLSNQIKALNSNSQQQGVVLWFETFSQAHPWVYFVVAVGMLLLWLRWGFAGAVNGPLLVVVGLVFLVIAALHQPWMASHFNYLRWPVLLVLMWVVLVYRRLFRKPKDMAWLLLAGSLAVAAFLQWRGDGGWGFLRGLPFYFVWAWVQQLLLGPVCSDLLYEKMNRSAWMTAGLVGLLFSLLHAPNHMLMAVTLAAGVVWSLAWLRYRNLYMNAFSHALLALVFYQSMPSAWLGSARIGVFF